MVHAFADCEDYARADRTPAHGGTMQEKKEKRKHLDAEEPLTLLTKKGKIRSRLSEGSALFTQLAISFYLHLQGEGLLQSSLKRAT